MSFLASCPQSCQGRAPPRSSIQPVMLHKFQQHTSVSAATTYSSVTRPAEEHTTNSQVHVGLFHIQSARTSLFLFVDFLKAKRACLSTTERSHEIRRQQQAKICVIRQNHLHWKLSPTTIWRAIQCGNRKLLPLHGPLNTSFPLKKANTWKGNNAYTKKETKMLRLSFTPSGDIGWGGLAGGGLGGGGGDGLGGGRLGGGGAAAVKGEEQGHSSSAAMHAKQGFHSGGGFEANVA